eukprot:1196226-Prorocentrum_minimum.AAC.4
MTDPSDKGRGAEASDAEASNKAAYIISLRPSAAVVPAQVRQSPVKILTINVADTHVMFVIKVTQLVGPIASWRIVLCLANK